MILYRIRPKPGEELPGTIYSTSSLLLLYIIYWSIWIKKNITHVITFRYITRRKINYSARGTASIL